MTEPSNNSLFNNNTTTARNASATRSTTYSYRNRDSIKTPPAFPVAFSPLRIRSTKRVTKGYKTTATVTMPVKVKSDGVTNSKSSSTAMTAEEKAAIRAVRLAARSAAKGKEVAASAHKVVDEDVCVTDIEVQE